MNGALKTKVNFMSILSFDVLFAYILFDNVVACTIDD
jgi:hypothetical protein